MTIIHEGRPELEVGFWQSKFKVGDHGAVHDLPYTVKSNGGTKTEKSDDNTLKMMGSIVDMPNRNNVKWFEAQTPNPKPQTPNPALLFFCLVRYV